MPLNEPERVASIVCDAGGKIVGRTRLQKVSYLLCVAGFDDGFSFSYKHYGPYSEDLACAARDASLLGLVTENEYVASWGGLYSVYSASCHVQSKSPEARRKLASLAVDADAIELELAATAAFLAKEGCKEPWDETARRKPEKAAEGRIDRAKALYAKLCLVNTPMALPAII